MRHNAKRSIEEIVMGSDSEDADWNETSQRPSRHAARKSKGSPHKKSQPAKKRQRRGSDIVSDNDSMSDEDISSIMEESEEENLDDTEIQRNARGTARRRTAQHRPLYEESPVEDDEDDLLDEDEDEDEVEVVSPHPKKSAVVKLKIRPEILQEAQSNPGRRTTRRTRGASEDIYALTNSGRHMETVERGTLSPEAEITRRSSRQGSRALKQPVVSEEVVTTTEVRGSFEVLESDAPQSFAEGDATIANDGTADQADLDMTNDSGVIPESENGEVNHDEEEDEEDEGPTTRRRSRATRNQSETHEVEAEGSDAPPRRSSRKKPSRSSQRKGKAEESDFEPEEEGSAEDESESDSAKSSGSPRKASQAPDEEESSTGGRRTGLRKRPSRSRAESEVAIELAEELDDLRGSRPRRRMAQEIVYEKPRRSRKNVDYRIIRPDLFLPIEEAENEAVTESPSRRGRGGGGGGWQRTLFPTYGPFGGGGPSAILGPAGAPAATGGVDSDSSDDEAVQQPKSAALASGGGLAPQTHSGDAAQNLSGTPANFGKVKDKQALADADPLGVDINVNFDSVGGLQGHINQLKEMVSLPLLYPEIFQRFHIVPPRGVLFHGPPGTGKTLLARALANSVSSEGRKVTFYMRKGADALSKWVGEAERQLRLLFEEARKTQPSIIFFDEIDGKYRTHIYKKVLWLTLSRLGPCAIKQTRANPCLHCLNPAGFDGWHGRSWPSHCRRSHQSTRLCRPSASSPGPLRSRILLPASQQ